MNLSHFSFIFFISPFVVFDNSRANAGFSFDVKKGAFSDALNGFGLLLSVYKFFRYEFGETVPSKHNLANILRIRSGIA